VLRKKFILVADDSIETTEMLRRLFEMEAPLCKPCANVVSDMVQLMRHANFTQSLLSSQFCAWECDWNCNWRVILIGVGL